MSWLQLEMILSGLCGHHVLVCLPDNVGAVLHAIHRTDGVLRDLRPDLDQGIGELPGQREEQSG